MSVYLTYAITKPNKTTQQDLFDAIFNGVDIPNNEEKTSYANFHTVLTNEISITPTTEMQINEIKNCIKAFAIVLTPFINDGLEKHYTSFKIPKRNGKLRQIDAPDEDLKQILRQLKDQLQNRFKCLPHNAAFAYVKNRAPLDALKKHQRNESKWFLKLDLKNFFPSCNESFIHAQLSQIHPFSQCYTDKESQKAIFTVIQGAMLRGGLPQGTPLSPFLTNIIMIPIDYAIHNLCKQFNKQHLVYTRYADDILISSKYNFDFKEVEKQIDAILKRTSPLQINREKTRYGSAAGSNWNLGLMLNKDNNITLGYKAKRELKKDLLSICTTIDAWAAEDLKALHGTISYFLQIEPEYITHIIRKYSEKYNKGYNIVDAIRERI